MKTILSLLFALALLSGCGMASGEDEFSSVEEARYADAGRPFAQAIFKGDYDRAYDMLSSHAKAKMTAAQFRATHETARREYFVPKKAEAATVLETEAHILAGRSRPHADATDRRLDQMTYQRHVGEVPDDVPAGIRRASLSATFHDRSPKEPSAQSCFLTFLLVEDAGRLRVAHFFYRWPDMLD